MKNNLPVILLRGLVLLPFNDLKMEFEADDSRKIIDEAISTHNGNLLVVTSSDPYESSPDISSLPKIGVIVKIVKKIVLPNGKIRIIISGIKRSYINDYMMIDNNLLVALVSDVVPEKLDSIEEAAIIRKVYRELELYIKKVPYIGNSVIELLSKETNLSKFTDLLAPSLPISIDRLIEYLKEEKPSERARMILMDVYREEDLYDVEKSFDLKVKKELDKNQRDYILKEKLKMIKEELGEVSTHDGEVAKLKQRLEKLEASDKVKEHILSEINKYESLNQQSPEVSMSLNYIEWLLDLPWDKATIDNEDLKKAKDILDESHDGLDKVKERIIEYLAVKKITKSLDGPIICLVGPPGVGKTSLAFAIAKATNRNFVKMSVGGVSDETEIIGHRRTYLGAMPGRVIKAMKKASSCNPVFLIDEVDKMTHDIHGDPASALLSVLDPLQNKFFSDDYIEEEYDLSKVMFILTANYIDKIPEPLKDRLEIINLSGYTQLEKLSIAKKHLIPKVTIENGLDKKIKIKDEVLLFIIEKYTKEAGVRELERLLSKIVRKIVTKIALDEFKPSMLNVNIKSVIAYLGNPIYEDVKVENRVGIINGLAYTPYGGLVLPIEVNYYKGHGNLVLTGSLGDVMKESAEIAFDYVKANYQLFNIDYKMFTDYDVHIHALEGAVPKDGPSAGIALCSAIISALSNQKVLSSIAMTGEISLHGDILPIGGLKEKALGAYRNGITKILYPFENKKDLDDIPLEVKDKITFIPVKNYLEVYHHIKEAS